MGDFYRKLSKNYEHAYIIDGEKVGIEFKQKNTPGVKDEREEL